MVIHVASQTEKHSINLIILRTMKNKEVWKFVIQTAISILSAIATALGVTSCMA